MKPKADYKELVGFVTPCEKCGFDNQVKATELCLYVDSQRSQLLKSLVEEVEGMKIEVPYINDDPAGKARALAYQETYNQALQDVIKLLEDLTSSQNR